jgi:hypothetical protein
VIAPIDDPVLFAHDGPGFWRQKIHGLDFSSLEELELQQGRAAQLRVEPGAMLAKGEKIVSLDLKKAKVGDHWQRGAVEFEIERDGVLNGFVGWFEAQLSKSERLDTGPREPETHWSQSYLPFPPRPVRKGSRLRVKYDFAPDPLERRNVRLVLEAGRERRTYAIE